VRLLCPHCKEETPLHPHDLPRNYKPDHPLQKHYIARGCDQCFYTGYRGRKALYEIIPLDHELSSLIKTGSDHIEKVLKEKNIKTLSQVAFELIEAGYSSVDECYSILMSG